MPDFAKSLRVLGLHVTVVGLLTVLLGCPGVVVPAITSVTPNVVPATTVDTLVTFGGRNFQNGATATFTSVDGVTVNATVATTYVGSTTLTCTAPKSALVAANLPVSVTISNPDGNVSDPVSVTYTPPPDVTTVTPSQAPATIATALTLAGQNFSGPAEVRFRRPDTTVIGTPSATVVSSNSIQVTSPVDNTLTTDTLVTVEVINNDDQISAKVVKAAGSMTYLAPPTVTAITPGSSALDTIPANTGTAVTITGTNFEAGMTVSFDLPVSGPAAAANVVVVDATTLTCDAPAEPTLTADATADVTVTAPDGQTSAPLASFYSAPPIVTGMNPAELPVSVEYPFTITGTGFKAGATVIFDLPTAGPTAAVAPITITSTVITGTSPIEPAGVAAPAVITVTVANPDGQSGSATCTYWPPPVVNAAATPNPTPTVNLTSTIEIPNLQISGDLFRPGTIVTFRDSVLIRIEDAATAVSGTGATAGGSILTCATPVIDDPSPPNPRGPRLLADEPGSLLIVGPQGQTASISLPVTYVAPPILTQGAIAATFTPGNVPATVSTDWNIADGANFDTTSVDIVFTRLDTNAVIGTVTVAPPADAQNVSGTVAGGTGTPLLSGITVPTNVLVQVRNQDQQISVPGITIVYDPPPVIDSVLNDATSLSEVGATATAAARNLTINGANFVTGATLEFDLPGAGWTPVASTVVDSAAITCVAPALASGTITADTAVGVRITNPDTQVSDPNGSINYQAEPHITTIQTFDSTGAAIPGNVIPSSIADTTTFTITDAQGNFVTLPGNVPAVTFTGQTTAFVSTATGVVVNSEASLDGVPQNVTITVHETADVLVTDEYLQPSNTITVQFTAPPVVTLFEAELPKPGFQPDVFGATNPVPIRLTGDNFQANAEVEFFDSAGGTSLATVTMPTLSVDDTELTGADTPLLSITSTLTNAAIVVTNTDGQSSTAYEGIKIVAPPAIKAVTLLNGDPAAFVPNGALRNDWNSANGPAVTFHLSGTNLDSQTPGAPATGWAEIALSGDALAVDGVLGTGAYPAGGDDLARIVSDTAVQFELRDNPDGMLANLLGYVDVLSLEDWTGQTTTTGIADAMLTILGPTAASEMNAAGLATGDFSADGIEDLLVVQSDATTVRVTAYPGLATGGYEIRPAQTIVSSVAPLGNGLTTPGSKNVLVVDLDQDGYDDLLVGIPGRDFVRTAAGANAAGDAGALYIWYGTASGLPATPTATIDATLTVAATGAAGLGEGFGAAIAAGDHNGDGYTDLVVSAPGTATTSGSAGIVYFYQGNGLQLGDNPPPGSEREISGSASTPGVDQPDGFGLGLALGDWDGDADDELFVGAPGFNDSTAGLDAGKVVVYFGDSNMDTTVDWELPGGAAGNASGYAVVADIDGDLIDDLLRGSPKLGVNFAASGSGGSFAVFLGRSPHSYTADAAFGWSCANDTVGIASNIVPIPGTCGLFVGASHIISGNLPGRAGLFHYDGGTATFSQVLGYKKPVGTGLAIAGEGFATGLAYIPMAAGGMDVFAAIPGGIGGANDGFVAYYPASMATYGSQAGSQAIPDASQLAATIEVPDSMAITDLNVRIEVRHANLADLTVTLQSPAGTTVSLLAAVTGANLAGTAFDDEAAATIDTGASPFSGAWQIDSSAGGSLLSALDGEDTCGTWTLTIQDTAAGNTGTLEAWSITFNTPENP